MPLLDFSLSNVLNLNSFVWVYIFVILHNRHSLHSHRHLHHHRLLHRPLHRLHHHRRKKHLEIRNQKILQFYLCEAVHSNCKAVTANILVFEFVVEKKIPLDQVDKFIRKKIVVCSSSTWSMSCLILNFVCNFRHLKLDKNMHLLKNPPSPPPPPSPKSPPPEST